MASIAFETQIPIMVDHHMVNRKRCTFLLSIDTEEEWDWDGPLPQSDCSVANAQELPAFHTFCQSLGVKPTYFIDYAMLNNVRSVKALQTVFTMGGVEMGSHLHPWCNPPYFGETNEESSHLINLPKDQVAQKLDALTQKVTDSFGVRPTAFRTGRWGTNGDTLKLLVQQGYHVDSSTYPYFYTPYFCGHDVDSKAYYPCFDNVNKAGEQRDIVELPISAGFNRLPFSRASRWHEWLERSVARHARPIGVFWRLGWLKKLYLSPELSSEADLLLLTKTLLRGDYPIIHMYFHSSSLLPNFRTSDGIVSQPELIMSGIRTVVEYLQQNTQLEFATVTGAAKTWADEQ